ncbi:MAG: fimbrillin family protein [Bacteroides sp.]|nr:fimbrillin family protein [Bacteroides sp.]
MKKSLFLMAMAGVALAGCVNDVADVTQKEQKALVSFSSPLTYNNGAGTRAGYHGEVGKHQYSVDGTGTVYSYPREEDFVIYAVKHEGDLVTWEEATETAFNGATLKYDSDVDGWAPTIAEKTGNDKYYTWDSGYKMSYAACSPADLEQADDWNGRSYGATGLQITNFQVPGNAAKHFDLMYSVRQLNKTKADMIHTANKFSGLPIVFKHMLSSIRFSIANQSSQEIYLKSVRVYGVKYKGTFTENVIDGATYIANNPGWDVDEAKIEEANAYVAFSTTGDGLKFPLQARYLSDMIAAGDGNTVHQLLLMPQELMNDAVVEIGYTIGAGTSLQKATVKLNTAVLKQDNSEELTNTTITEWLIGTRYTYRLYYSNEAAVKDMIYFSPSSDGWVDAGVAVINLANAH